MIISEFQKHIESVKATHGDLEIVVRDADTDCILPIVSDDLKVANCKDAMKLVIQIGLWG